MEWTMYHVSYERMEGKRLSQKDQFTKNVIIMAHATTHRTVKKMKVSVAVLNLLAVIYCLTLL